MKRILSGLTTACLLLSMPWFVPRAGSESSGTITFNPNEPSAESSDSFTFNPNGTEEDGSDTITLNLSVANERESIPFLQLGDVWGMSFQEIQALYPDYVIERKDTRIHNEDPMDVGTAEVIADRYVVLGWTKYGGTMVLCERKGKGGECTIGYTNAFNMNEWTKQAEAGHIYPDYHPDRDVGLPAQMEAIPAIALQDIQRTYYSEGYWFEIDFIKDEKLTYLGTIETGKGKFDYVHSQTGRRGKSYNVFIPHGMIRPQIPISMCQVTLLADRYGYDGGIIYPDVEVRYKGQLLTEGEDYEILSDSSEPGPARAVIRGMGYYDGDYPVNYTICHTTIALDEIRQIAEGEYAAVTAIIWTTDDDEAYAGAPSAETVHWELEGKYQTAEWEEQITDHQDLDYLVTRKVKPEKPGEYRISVMYNGVRASKKFVVEPKLGYTAGPLWEDGSPVEGKNRDFISSYTDLRLSVEYDIKNIPFLHEFLKKTADENLSYNDENTEIYSSAFKTETFSDEEGNEIRKTLSLVYRVQSSLPENEKSSSKYHGWFEVMTPARQHIHEKYRISNGILAKIGYRSELQSEEKHWFKPESYLPAKEDSHLFYFDDQYFYKDSDRYQNNLAVMSLGLEMSSYSTSLSDLQYGESLAQEVRARNLVSAWRALGFNDYQLYRYGEPLTSIDDNVAYSFGLKYIASEKSDDTLVAVVLRGGGYGAEWSSNFKVGQKENHNGFDPAAQDVANYLEAYIGELKRENRIIGDLKIWITGFSRAAAVSNLLGEKLAGREKIEEVPIQTKNTFIYTFATPAGHYGRISGKTGHIFNIVSPNDLVPKLAPAAWNYHRNGTNIYLPEKTAEAVKDAFMAYRNEELKLSNIGLYGDAVIDALTSLYPNTDVFLEAGRAVYPPFGCKAISEQRRKLRGRVCTGISRRPVCGHGRSNHDLFLLGHL